MKKKILVTIMILIVGFFISKKNRESSSREREISITKNIGIISQFEKDIKGEIILAKEMDVNRDGETESFIIYKKNSKVWLTVAYKFEDKMIFSEAVSAPMMGQELTFNDFDGDGEVEFVVSGYKEEKIGYGVFKFSDYKIIDIFTEGMKECC